MEELALGIPSVDAAAAAVDAVLQDSLAVEGEAVELEVGA